MNEWMTKKHSGSTNYAYHVPLRVSNLLGFNFDARIMYNILCRVLVGGLWNKYATFIHSSLSCLQQ
jgi:hypothetical protein